jgi:hypothetical protein
MCFVVHLSATACPPLSRTIPFGAGGSTADYRSSYDANGNLTAETVNGATTNYTYNHANELTNTGYSFDANGNMTASPTLSALAYNGKNQTSSITPTGGSAISMTYRGSGQPDRASAGSDTFTTSKLGTASRTSGGNSTYFIHDPAGAPSSPKNAAAHPSTSTTSSTASAGTDRTPFFGPVVMRVLVGCRSCSGVRLRRVSCS